MHTRHQVLLVLAIILGTVAWAVTGSSESDPYRDVHTLEGEPDAWYGRPVSMKGTVVAGTIETDDVVRFLLADESGDPAHNGTTLAVTYAGVLPDAFGPKPVVVTGTLVEGAAGPVFHASDIQVGCSSKY